MIVLTVDNIRKHYGPEAVLDGASFDIRAGEHVALVGPNGAGKSTLFRIVAGKEEAELGTVSLAGGCRMGVLEQHPVFEHPTVWEEAKSALKELLQLQKQSEEISEKIGSASPEEQKSLALKFDRLHSEIERRGGYNIDHKIERILEGLGFPKSTFAQPVDTLSGGQKNRLLLAKLLLEEPDLMLLDEPSNHLDIASTRWLEEFLMASQQAVLVVSHDRYFLDKVATRTLELFHGTVDSYPGNYTKYVSLKAERLEVQKRTFEKQQTEIAKIEDFIRRNHAGQKSLQAEDRRKKLERIERVALPKEISSPPMGFPKASRTGDIVVRAEKVSKSFDKPLFTNLTFDILRGEKWGILGANGAGKTTLIRCLLGDEELSSGKITLGAGVKVAYFDQQLRCIDSNTQPVEAIRPAHKDFVEQQRRDLLAKFGITGDMVFQPISSLSGGERNRVALAKLAVTDANVLVLDEPTNHLDLWARGSLEAALREFDGTVLFVSHDRYFLNQIADHLIVVEPNGSFRVIDGNYNTYLNLVEAGIVAAQQANAAEVAKRDGNGKADASTNSKQSGSDKPKRKRKFPYRKLVDIETDIAQKESLVQQFHDQLTQPEVLRDGLKVKKISDDLEEAQAALMQLYEHWEEASELNG